MAKHKDVDLKNVKVDLIASIANPSGISVHARNLSRVLATVCDFNLPLFNVNETTDCMSGDDINFIMQNTKGERASDIKLHFTLPPRWQPIPDAYNIGILSWETSKLPDKDINLNDNRPPASNNWVTQCNRMNEIWTFSKTSEAAIKNSGVTVPIHIFSGPIDTDFWNPDAPILEKGIYGVTHDSKGAVLKDKFVVGYVADWSERKDIETFLSCAMVAIPPNEGVVLLKSTNRMTKESAKDLCKAIKSRMVMYALPPVIVIDEMMKDEEVRGLMQAMDVYACTSRGEGLNLPIMQAMSMEKPVIAGSHSAHVDYMDGKNGVLLPVNLEIARTMIKNPWYQNDQIWGKVNEVALVQSIQELYRKWKAGDMKKLLCADARTKMIKDHSYESMRPKFAKRIKQIMARDAVGSRGESKDSETFREPKIPDLPKRGITKLDPSI